MPDKQKDKTEQALEKKSTAEMEEALKNDWMSKEQTIKAKNHFTHKRLLVPQSIINREGADNIDNRVLALKMALRSPELHGELVEEIFGDLIAGAYQNRSEAYSIVLSKYNFEELNKIMKMRQSVDNHLLNVLRTIRNIKRPPVQVVVKQAEQVNVAEQINQGDKQVNIAKNQQNG